MKKGYILGIAIIFSFAGHSQIEVGDLEGNNVRATISNSGRFFSNEGAALQGYEYPKNSMNHLIYSLSFWYGGLDSGGSIKMAADIYGGEDSRDTYPGAITDDGAAEAPIEPYADEIYFVSQAEITNHIYNHDELGYEMPYGIEHWPAHGDISQNLDYYLAPFKDLDGDGNYEPETGEYPLIRGDHAAYLIMNDKGGLHGNSGGEPLGIELHYMFYQYETEDDINNTTFINVRVINRGTNSFPTFIVGSFLDGDVGFSSDDFIGTNSDNNLIYTYNGTTEDDGESGQPGYGADVPAVGLMSLNRTMNVGGYFNNSPGPYGPPTIASDYWSYMNANWKTGEHFRYGGNGNTTASEEETNYLYSGNPNDVSDGVWNESNEANPPGDRRVFMAIEPTSLDAGEELCYDFAVIANSGDGNNFENAAGLLEVAPLVQAFYDNQTDNYCEFFVGIDEVGAIESINIYPNPSKGTFTVDLTGEFDLEIYSMDGRLVESVIRLSGHSPIKTQLSSGTYLLVFNQNNVTYRAKLIVE